MAKRLKDEDRSPYGLRLFQARTTAKLSQPELAKAAGMAQSTLAGLEKDGQGSSFTPQLAAACGVRVDWLATGDGPMKGDTLSKDVAATAAEIEKLPPRLRQVVLRVAWEQINAYKEATLGEPEGSSSGGGAGTNTGKTRRSA